MSSIPSRGYENNLQITEDQISKSISNNNAKRILAFLRAGEKKISWTEFRNVILIFGNTGSGKTSLAHFLARDNKHLVAYEIDDDSGEFLLKDIDNEISVDSTCVSKTVHPQLFFDAETDDIYMDFPGFEDCGRNEAYDLGAAFFIKKVLEKTKNVKIVFAASYSSLRKGVCRNGFRLLLEHVCTLIKNIDKYLDSVALIATKVDNNYIVRNGVAILVPDSSVICNIGQFLREVKDSIRSSERNQDEIYSSEHKVAENKVFVENSLKLIDALLPKIALFRRPDVRGPVSEIQRLQDGKKIIKTMIEDELIYVHLDMGDIKYTISAKSQYIIRDLTIEIHQNIESDLSKIKKKLIQYYTGLVSKMSHDTDALKSHLTASSESLVKIRSIDESSNAEDLVMQIRINLTEPCRQVANSLFDDVSSLCKFANFLAELCGRCWIIPVQKWIKELKAAIEYIEDSLKSISKSANNIFQWVMECFDTFKAMLMDILRSLAEIFCNNYILLN